MPDTPSKVWTKLMKTCIILCLSALLAGCQAPQRIGPAPEVAQTATAMFAAIPYDTTCCLDHHPSAAAYFERCAAALDTLRAGTNYTSRVIQTPYKPSQRPCFPL